MNKLIDDIYAVEFTAVPIMRCSFGLATANFDPSTAVKATVSNHNLTVTGVPPGLGGCFVFADEAKTSGKVYFEMKWVLVGGIIFAGEIGIATTFATVGDLNTATNSTMLYQGPISASGVSSGYSLGTISDGDVIGIAVDLDNRKIWFKNLTAGGLWNGSVAVGDPATNHNGVSIPSGALIPAVGFGLSNDVLTANFGASAFVGTVPSGFTPGWI
ncbi:hypothetical protein [Bradyrhizobium sp. USDA 4473]